MIILTEIDTPSGGRQPPTGQRPLAEGFGGLLGSAGGEEGVTRQPGYTAAETSLGQAHDSSRMSPHRALGMNTPRPRHGQGGGHSVGLEELLAGASARKEHGQGAKRRRG